MEARRPTFQPAGAGVLLAAATALGVAVGALLGWMAGSWGIGSLVGAMVGIPAGVFAVYRRYRGFFT
jgi:F0F1-type ATP synthase assembly protein I